MKEISVSIQTNSSQPLGEKDVPMAFSRLRKVLSTSFVFSAGLILIVTGIAKVWSTFGNAKLLATADPIIGIKFGRLMLAVGVLEILIALVCFFRHRRMLPIILVNWFATSLFIYRLGLWWIHWQKPCGCLGDLTEALHIAPQTADNIMKILLAYMLIASYGLLFFHWKGRLRLGTKVTVH